ncbi:MAG: FAD-dependent oxidoreductase [Spirochaetaceae bacterium]|nr:FAD-dependent oxidoreductase [Spirochaetaceae bacterium]
MSDTGRRVAIVGSGPSGFYAAEALLKDERNLQVDIIDRLPTPFGLVRGGVAPDHQKIKNVIRIYERTAGNDRCSFIGNVMVGRDVSVADLQRFYDAVVFTCGAETDRTLNIPGIDLAGSHTATAFVGWYNGHPDYRDLSFDLSAEAAVVIGQGNVAVDVTRILAKTVDELAGTDIAAHALEALAESKVREVHMVGRRGPVQAAFTSKEIRELGELGDCALHFNDQADFDLGPCCQAELDQAGNTDAQRNWKALGELREEGPASGCSKRIVVHFFRSPKELAGNGRVQRLTLEKNRLAGEAGDQWAEGTGETVEMDCGLFFRSVGYRGVPIEGLPFDDRRGVFPNQGGRITADGAVAPGLYAAGWIKRGPSGVIGTNKPDSTETAKNLLADLDGLAACAVPDTDALLAQLRDRGVRPISYEDWRAIDAAEVARGAAAGKPREKFTRIEEMLAVLD